MSAYLHAFDFNDWKKYSSENFVMYSDRSEKDVRETLKNSEIFRATIKELMRIEDNQALQKVTIYQFNSQNDFVKYTDSRRTAGLYTYRDLGPIIVMATSRNDDLLSTDNI